MAWALTRLAVGTGLFFDSGLPTLCPQHLTHLMVTTVELPAVLPVVVVAEVALIY